MTTHDDALPARLSDDEIDGITRDRWGTQLLGVMVQAHREYARAVEQRVRAALAARAGEPVDDRPTWFVPHAITIRCLRAAEDRIRAGDPPAEVFADYGWTMDAAPPAPSHEAMREVADWLTSDLIGGWRYMEGGAFYEDARKYAALLRAALGGGGR